MKKILIILSVLLLVVSGCTKEKKEEYKLTIAISGTTMGSVTVQPQKEMYTAGETVRISAVPTEGNAFYGWEGANSTSVRDITIKMDNNKTLKAVFGKKKYFLNIKPSEDGTIDISPVKECYFEEDLVTLIPVPAPGYKFDKWLGDDALLVKDGKITFTNKDINLSMQFKNEKYTVALEIQPAGKGTVTKVPEQNEYIYGDEIILTPSAISGYVFAGWGGTGNVDTGNKLCVRGNTTVTALFVVDYPLFAVNIAVVSNGAVEVYPKKEKYSKGEIITLVPVPKAGYEFKQWSGEDAEAIVDSKIVLNKSINLVPAFDTAYTLTIDNADAKYGDIIKIPDKIQYVKDEIVTLKVNARTGYALSGWSGENGEEVENLKIVINGHKKIQPIFTIDTIPDLITMKIEKDDTGLLDNYKKYFYENNIETKEENYKADGELDNYDVFEYKNGILDITKHYNQENILKYSVKNTYNNDGTLQKESEYDADSQLIKYYIYEYVNGIKTQKTRYNITGAAEKKWEYFTDGLIITGSKEYDSTNKLTEETSFEYKDGKMIKETRKDGLGAVTNYYVYAYDISEKNTGKIRYSEGGIPEKTWENYYGISPVCIPVVKDTKIWNDNKYYESIFKKDHMNEMEIFMTQKEWDAFIAELKINMKSGVYFKAKFAFKGELGNVEINDVGFRIRGNMSRERPDLGRAHFKIKFDETFDFSSGSEKYLEANGRKFSKLQALNLKWPRGDETQTTEMYAYKTLEESGLDVPKTGAVKLYITIGGVRKDYGVYTMMEPIDEEFFSKRLGKEAEGGDLYKCLFQDTPATLQKITIPTIGMKPENRSWKPTYDLLTNKSKGDFTQLKNFITNVDDLTGSAFKIYLDNNFEVEGFIKTLAMDMLIGNADDYWAMANNYYLYFNPAGKISFVQFDYDNSLGMNWAPAVGGKNIPTANMFEYLPLIRMWYYNPYLVTNILAEKVFEIPEYKEKYVQYLEQFTAADTGIFNYSKYEQFYKQMETLYTPYIMNDWKQQATMSQSTKLKTYYDTKYNSITTQLKAYRGQ